MRHFRPTLIALVILILAVVPLVGCIPSSAGEDWKYKYETLQIEHTILKAELQSVKSDLDYVKASSKTLRNDNDTLKAKYDRLQADHVTLEATSKKLQADYDSLKRDSILYDTAWAAQKAAYDSLKTNYDSLKTLYNQLVKNVRSGSTTPPTPTYQTWIDVYQATYGKLPVVPDWMLDLMPQPIKAGDRFRKGVTLNTASGQYWARRSPTEKQMILETLLWLGENPDDYLWKMEQMRPPSGNAPRVTWGGR